MFRVIDAPDRVLRVKRGLGYLPPFSIRVRSRGVANQFGGQLFKSQGDLMVGLLDKHVGLKKSSDVVEIGCGCGCAATALVEVLSDGTYLGYDIDAKSIESCRKNKRFIDAGFGFQWIDVYNSQYNPDGEVKAEDYIFALDDNSKDIVFLTSVFTHMLPKCVDNYMAEISRILRPGGRLLTTVFLMDEGFNGKSINFPYEYGDCRVHQLTFPERGVGYNYEYIEGLATKHGLVEHNSPVYGNWRSIRADGEDEESGFGQDILTFSKPS